MPGTAVLSYAPVGSSLDDAVLARPPRGFRRRRVSAVVGHGPRAFETARGRMLAWEIQRGSGIDVETHDGLLAEGDDVRQCIRLAGLRFAAPARVVRVIDEPARFAYALGTLPGHPLRGEEAFVLGLAADGAVRLELRQFSRASGRWRWAQPAIMLLQARIARRFLDVLGPPGTLGS